MQEFTIAIVGGGVGGLTLALGLLHRNVPVKVYEASSEIKTTGMGLSVGPAAARTLPLIDPRLRDLYESILTTPRDIPGGEQTWFEYLWMAGPTAGKVFADIQSSPLGHASVGRTQLLRGLASLLPPGTIQFGKKLIGFEETDDAAVVKFQDGTEARATVVIGCDGIHSKVKEYVTGGPGLFPPVYSGCYAYRATLDQDTVVGIVGHRRASLASKYLGDGAYCVTYPIMNHTKVNIGFFKQSKEWKHDGWVVPATKEQMRQDFKHLGEPVNALLESIPDSQKWAVLTCPPLPTYTRSRVAILGDAAHAAPPHNGAGAGQAIEDAHVLCELLADPRVTGYQQAIAALQAYDAIRRPRSQQVVAHSKSRGYLVLLRAPGIGSDQEKVKSHLKDGFDWIWDLDVKKQVERAQADMLARLIALPCQ